ncbi:CPBP family intramembrane metalloprotease [Euhalothece natronophila Z-M001]|uniref:CPBP family intramembrane metalloprotease n=1 Tax=Euhalothece natronophila Z-M001 TaxID=522448 RepID=A0A5B8NLI1_9CHRO|nr:type II CAAX endopeptidase family protein [Euhalothece natronophila]QDZ39858.1 CPBP family intramembrane metalloprotease [Euhalothece natronophila Z-M001]
MQNRIKQIQSLAAPLRIGLFIFVLLLIWLPVAIPIQVLLAGDQDLVTILTMGWLFVLFLILVRVTEKFLYQKSHPYQAVGLTINSRFGLDLLQGLIIGLILTFTLFLLQGSLGWLNWQDNALPFWQLILEGALTGIGVGIAEEALFRGWLLNELQRDYSLNIALWVNAIIFAIAHFIKPLDVILETFPEFPGLVLLGLVLVWARRKTQGQLGLAIGLHGGLVWAYYIINVGDLITYSDRASPIITGLDGNPISGIMGWLFLMGLAVWLQWEIKRSS